MEVIILDSKEIYLISVSLITVLTIVVLRSFGLVQPMSWLTSTLTNIGGALLGNKLQGNSAKANAEIEAKLQRENWEYMQGNKHQLEVKDLRKAGLNPILSSGQGSAVSAPSISGDALESQLGKNIADSITAAKQLKIAQTEADSNKIAAEAQKTQAETAKNLAEFQSDFLKSQTDYYHYSSGLQLANTHKVEQEISHAIERHKYELDNLASQTEYNRSLTSQAYANISLIRKNIDLVGEQVGLTRAQKEDIQRKLDDPRSYMNKEFWQNVKNSDDPMYVALRASYQRGLSNDIFYSFYSEGTGSNIQDAESLARISGQVKYLLK